MNKEVDQKAVGELTRSSDVGMEENDSQDSSIVVADESEDFHKSVVVLGYRSSSSSDSSNGSRSSSLLEEMMKSSISPRVSESPKITFSNRPPFIEERRYRYSNPPSTTTTRTTILQNSDFENEKIWERAERHIQQLKDEISDLHRNHHGHDDSSSRRRRRKPHKKRKSRSSYPEQHCKYNKDMKDVIHDLQDVVQNIRYPQKSPTILEAVLAAPLNAGGIDHNRSSIHFLDRFTAQPIIWIQRGEALEHRNRRRERFSRRRGERSSSETSSPLSSAPSISSDFDDLSLSDGNDTDTYLQQQGVISPILTNAKLEDDDNLHEEVLREWREENRFLQAKIEQDSSDIAALKKENMLVSQEG